MKLFGWHVLLVVISSILFEETGGDFLSGANQAVRCMLSHKEPKDCASLPKVIVPSYLLQVFDDSPSSLHEALRKSSLAHLSEDQLAQIPLSLLYLIPRGRLADLKGDQLRAILRSHADDTSLTRQVAACLHHENKLLELFKKVKGDWLSAESQQILAESIELADLTKEFLRLSVFEKQSLLAYIRPAVLLKADKNAIYDILLLLQLTELSKPPKKSTFYFLTEAAIRNGMTISKLTGYVLGSSPDQLLNESLSYDTSVASFRHELSLVQARALFERVYNNTALSSSNFIDAKPLLYKLSPELLREFPPNVPKYEVNEVEQILSIPLPTACQVTEYVKADCILTRKLPKEEDEFWDSQIRHLGKWVYTLPLSRLQAYKESGLSTAVLKTLESSAISPIQAYYLSGKGEALDVMTPNTVLELETFLHALPASQLTNRKLGEISSHVLLHLVSKLPAHNRARTLSLVNKIASSIGDTTDDIGGDSSVLEELLGNSDINQIMELVSPKDLALSAEAMLKFFGEKRIRTSFGQTIEQLPQQILAALLEHAQLKNSSQWRWNSFLKDSQVTNLLVGGLTCKHIEDMDTGLFIPIMARYNAVRKEIFPKNLQHCCLQKLISHLKLKMTLTQTDPDQGLISLLEPIEVESVGGFVLTNLPIDALQASPYLGHILAKIGRLSSAELMLSTDISSLKLIAELAVDKEKTVDTFLTRNLIWFLPSNTNTPELRLMLEAGLLNTTLCLPANDRRDIAKKLLAEFGPPEHWSSGVLATLQDLLIVFTDEELNKIPKMSWTKAADSLMSHYTDLIDWIEPSSFYKICVDTLGKSEESEYKSALGRYARWRLKAAQWLLDTVAPISQPEPPKYTYVHVNSINQHEESRTPISVFNPDFESTTEEADESDYEEDEDDVMKTEEASSTKKYEETTTDSTTEKTSTEERTTEKSTTEQFTTEAMDDSGTTNNVFRSITEKSASETSSEKSVIYTSETTTTQTKISQEISSTKKSSEETVTDATTNELVTERIGAKNFSALISTTKPTILNTTSTNTTYNNDTSKISPSSPKNITDTKNLSPCENSVSEEECAATSSGLSPNSTDIASSSSTTPHSFNETFSSFSKNQSNYSILQNLSTTPTEQFNKTEMSTISPTTKKMYYGIPGNYSSLQTSKNKTSTVSVNNSTLHTNNTSSVKIPEKNVTYSVNPKINVTQTTKYQPVTESLAASEEEEEQIVDVSNQDNNYGIIKNPHDRRKRGLFNFEPSEIKLTCNAIKMVGSLAELTLTKADIHGMSSTDIAGCRVEFGTMELSEDVHYLIWQNIDNSEKLDGIHLLNRLLGIAKWADIWDIKFRTSDPWILETVHAVFKYNNDSTTISKVLRQIAKHNSEFSVDLIAALGPAVCSIEPENLRALSVIGLDLGSSCPPCLPYLAERATEELGNVNSWTLHFVHSLQAIVAGLDLESWKQLAVSFHKPLSALQPSAARCLNASHLEVLSPQQIRMIPAITLLSLSEHQLAALNPTQLEAVKNVTHPTVHEKMTPNIRVHIAGFPGGSGISSHLAPTVMLITFLSVLHSIEFFNWGNGLFS